MSNKQKSEVDNSYNIAWSKYEDGKYPEAKALCNKIIKEQKGYWKAYYLKGIIFLENKEYENSVICFNEVLKLAKESKVISYIHYFLGEAYHSSFEEDNPIYDKEKAKYHYLESFKHKEYTVEVLYRFTSVR